MDRETALFRIWKEWHTSNRAGRHLPVGDALQLVGEGSNTSLCGSALALLHALQARHTAEEVLYLSQARAVYPLGMSELDAALHLLHPPDEELEVGGITVRARSYQAAPERTWPG